MSTSESHHGTPLIIELEGGRTIGFARLKDRDWRRWRARLAAADRRAVLAGMLEDRARQTDERERVPVPAIYKTANEQLTRPRPDREVGAYITSESRFSRRLLEEQAVAAGLDAAEAAEIVDGLKRDDREELATLLVAEAVVTLPFLIPLSRHRARERTRAMTRMAAAALAASATR